MPDGRVFIPGHNCNQLTLDNLRARTVDGVFFSASGKTLLACLVPPTRYVVPNGVATLDEEAFSGCNALESITFGTGLKQIGPRAFAGCVSLRSITLPNDVPLAPETFLGCPSDLTFYAQPGSDAEKYARDAGFPFKALAPPSDAE